jgi:hypothetical protein
MTKLHSGDQGDDVGATRPARPNRLTTWASFRGHTEGPGPAEYASNGINPPRIDLYSTVILRLIVLAFTPFLLRANQVIGFGHRWDLFGPFTSIFFFFLA